ncbi:MAG: hypothetical protein IJ072_08465, partial [Oscillospiraceae bacterium]|nr:hypothetical protein [Oscillospiraceae bacterium]
NGYSYRCVVKDRSGKTCSSEAMKLTVTKTIFITAQPKSVSVKAGAKATFSVKATGTCLTYDWQYSRDGETWANVGASITGSKTANMSFAAAVKYSGYRYRCLIKSSNGRSLLSDTATLTVK